MERDELTAELHVTPAQLPAAKKAGRPKKRAAVANENDNTMATDAQSDGAAGGPIAMDKTDAAVDKDMAKTPCPDKPTDELEEGEIPQPTIPSSPQKTQSTRSRVSRWDRPKVVRTKTVYYSSRPLKVDELDQSEPEPEEESEESELSEPSPRPSRRLKRTKSHRHIKRSQRTGRFTRDNSVGVDYATGEESDEDIRRVDTNRQLFPTVFPTYHIL